MSKLTITDVKKVAELAQLEMSESELSQIATHLGGILDYVALLEDVDTSNVEPLAHPFELQNVFREDVPTDMLPREQALKNAPKSDGKYFVVPAILDAGDA